MNLTLGAKDLQSIAGRCLGRSLHGLRYLPGGRNNRVARAESPEGPVLVKSYFHDRKDARDRLSSEFETLQLLWEHDLRCIPKPLACDRENRVAVYEFIDGQPGSAISIQKNDVVALVEFLKEVGECSRKPAFASRPIASDACFSLMEYFGTVDRRLEQLERVVEFSDFKQCELDTFLQNQFKPVFSDAKNRSRELPNLNLRLSASETILSPSDHGFHNAIKRADGRWVFIDFEYAGWDDPAKAVADACLHPGVPIPRPFQDTFVKQILDLWDRDGQLKDRLRVVYPLVALKWCLIILNEFVPVSSRRRAFADQSEISQDFRRQQLGLARQKLNEVAEIINGKRWISS